MLQIILIRRARRRAAKLLGVERLDRDGRKLMRSGIHGKQPQLAFEVRAIFRPHREGEFHGFACARQARTFQQHQRLIAPPTLWAAASNRGLRRE